MGKPGKKRRVTGETEVGTRGEVVGNQGRTEKGWKLGEKGW